MKERIRQLRKYFGLNQAEFAAKLSVSDGAVSQWEQGKIPHASRITLICQVFNVSKEWLMDGIGPMFNPPRFETDAEITRRHILDLFDQMPTGLQAEFLKICQDVIDKARQAQEERGSESSKSVTIGDNNSNINITQ